MKALFGSKKAAVAAIVAALLLSIAFAVKTVQRARLDRERTAAYSYYNENPIVVALPNEKSSPPRLGGGTTENNGVVSQEDQEWWNGLVGYWEGTIHVVDLRVVYRISPEYGRLFVYSLDQGGTFIPATGTSYDSKTKEFRYYFDSINGYYKAKLSPDRKTTQGTWWQMGRTFVLNAKRFVPKEETSDQLPRALRFAVSKSVTIDDDDNDKAMAKKLEGYWSGVLDDYSPNGYGKEDVIFQLEALADDLMEPSVMVPQDSPFPMYVRNLVISAGGDHIKIVLDQRGVNAIFNGIIEYNDNDDGAPTQMVGHVEFDDASVEKKLPLTLVWNKYPPTIQNVAAEEVALAKE